MVMTRSGASSVGKEEQHSSPKAPNAQVGGQHTPPEASCAKEGEADPHYSVAGGTGKVDDQLHCSAQLADSRDMGHVACDASRTTPTSPPYTFSLPRTPFSNSDGEDISDSDLAHQEISHYFVHLVLHLRSFRQRR